MTKFVIFCRAGQQRWRIGGCETVNGGQSRQGAAQTLYRIRYKYIAFIVYVRRRSFQEYFQDNGLGDRWRGIHP